MAFPFTLVPNQILTFTVTLDTDTARTVDTSFTLFINELQGINIGGQAEYSIALKGDIYDTPTVSRVGPALGSNNRVNMASGENTTFEVLSGDPLFPSANIKGYQWQTQRAGIAADSNAWDPTSGNGSAQRQISLTDAEPWTVYARMMDSNNVATAPVSINVTVWDRPVVFATGSGASWKTDTYVGVVNEPITLQASGSNASSEGNTDSITQYRWSDSAGNLIATQTPGQTVNVTFNQQSLSGSLSCVAVTGHGIESEERSFNLKVYPTLTVDVGGPYTGKPLEVVSLSGLANESGYPSATFSYEWKVDMDGDGVAETALGASGSPEIEYTWSVEGEYAVELTVTVTTPEALNITASDTGTVTLEAGVPTARHGGPYRGGIKGGNFSPTQFLGNLPGFIEDPLIGEIAAWQWTAGPQEAGLTFDDIDDYVVATNYTGVTGTSPRTVTAWIRTVTDGAVVSWGHSASTRKWIFRVQANGRIRVEVEGGGINGTTTVNDGAWHHVTAVLPDLAMPDVTDVLLYVDGVLEPISGSSPRAIDTSTNQAVWIGRDQSDRYFGGDMDDVAIFDRALDVTDIQDIMNNSLAGDELGLVAYWAFEEGIGTTTADVSGNGRDGNFVGDPVWFAPAFANDIYNPTREYEVAGTYNIGLRVQSEFGKWSAIARTTVTVIDGKVEGKVKAADLRTPVEAVTISLTSSHVDTNALSLVALNNAGIETTAEGGLSTETDEEGSYSFPNLPLGSYVLVASKGTGDDAHEFETKQKVTELTLDAPNQLAIDYVDLSVFPVGGQIYYSILKNGEKVYVEDVAVTAQPVGRTSAIEALDSTTSLDAKSQNYSMPLFAGEYLFKATRPGREVRLVGTQPSSGVATGSTPPGYDSASQLITIEDARTDIDFVDYTAW